MEKAVRYYNGKPFINSVSGKQDSMDRMLPIAAKYGGVLIALPLMKRVFLRLLKKESPSPLKSLRKPLNTV